MTDQKIGMEYTEQFTLTSDEGVDYRIMVGLPASYTDTDRNYPVLFVTDAEQHFGTIVGLSRLRSAVVEIDDVIIVGIACPEGTSIAEFAERRTYDTTTAKWDPSSPVHQVYAAAQTALGRTMRLGGASALVDFIVGKVKPRIREQYRVDPGNEGLLGHSGMGAFVGYALFARPGAFTHYVIGSPAFVQNDWEVFDLEERYAAEHDDLPAKIYLSAGALEVRDYALLQIVSGAARLAETLYHRGYPSLELEAEILSGKRHTTSAIEMMERALEYFWPGTPLQMSPEGTKALFEASTKRAERTW